MADVLFRVHKSALLPALDAVIEAVVSKPVVPILGNVLMLADGDEMIIRATDLSIEVEARCEMLAPAAGEGLTLSGNDLREIVKNLPDTAEIEISTGSFSGQVVLRAARSTFKLLSLPPDDFPSIAGAVHGSTVTVDMAALNDAIRRVSYAVRDDDKERIYLAGVAIHPEKDGRRISVVGCDGHNLAVVRFPCQQHADFRLALMPVRTAKAIRKLFADTKSAELTVSDAMIRIEGGGICLISKLVDAVYPDYMRVMPPRLSRKATVSVDTLSRAVARVRLVAEDESRNSVRMNVGHGVMRLALTTGAGQEAVEDFPVECDDEPMEIRFAGKYLTQLLGSIRTQDVTIELEDAQTSGVFRPTIAADEFFLVMPRAN